MRKLSYLVTVCVLLLTSALAAADEKPAKPQKTQSEAVGLRFIAYDPGSEREPATFQIEVHRPSGVLKSFQRLGARVPGTGFIIKDFVQKTVPGEQADRTAPELRELVLIDTRTGAEVILPFKIKREVPVSSLKK